MKYYKISSIYLAEFVLQARMHNVVFYCNTKNLHLEKDFLNINIFIIKEGKRL